VNKRDAKVIRWWALLPLLLFALTCVILYLNLDSAIDPKRVPSPFVGKALPRFQSTDLFTQAPFDSASLLGQPFILNIWGSWCPECVREHPVLNQYAAKPGSIAIIGLDHKEQDPADGKRWLERLGNPYRAVPVDPDGRIGIDLGVYGAPESFFVDAQGIVRYKHIGALNMALIEEKVQELSRAP
jgi:cytochrome c biogenesis protein CcmG, thiol:disulfide interchange protein DsbE